MCKECILEDLSKLYEFQKVMGKERVLVLPAFEDTRMNRVRFANELERFNYRNIPIDYFTIPLNLENTRQRYFGVFIESGNFIQPFFPGISYESFTQTYFDKIINEFFLPPIKK
jgi:hypothetical protein